MKSKIETEGRERKGQEKITIERNIDCCYLYLCVISGQLQTLLQPYLIIYFCVYFWTFKETYSFDEFISMLTKLRAMLIVDN